MPRYSSTAPTFWRGYSPRSSGKYAIRLRSGGANGRPKISTRPESGLIKSRMVRMSVVLPAPLGPSKPKISPRWTSSDTRSSASVLSNRFDTSSTRTAGTSNTAAVYATVDIWLDMVDAGDTVGGAEEGFMTCTTVRGVLARLAFVTLLPSTTFAQTGSIAGIVRDTSGAVMPGVTVEASSPALIEQARTATTDEKGQYKIVDLRPGVYVVSFTRPGFAGVKREGIELTTQFTAIVNADLRVGEITETVTVTGESPVVDTQRVQQVKVMTRDVIDAVPTGKTFQNIGVLVPGVTIAAGGTGATPYDVGGSSGEQQVQMAIHGGATADMVVQMDGMRFNNLCGAGSYTGVSGNDGAIEQIAFETGAISAEMGTGGIRVNMIPKEGGNSFKGTFFLNGANQSFQSDNFKQTLKDQGLAAVNRVKRVWDVNGSLGGPIKKDLLWFYFSSRYWGLDKFPADSFYDQDSRYYAYAPNRSNQGVDDTWNRSNAVRLTWQASARNKLTAYVDVQDRLTGHWFIGQGGIFGLTTPEASWIQTTPINHLIQTKYTSTISSRLLFE